MEEGENILEAKEKLEELGESRQSWTGFLAITTALIAVIAAIASLQAGNFSNQALLEKNNAVLFQSKASDQWNYYQAKGVKKNIAESFYAQTNDLKLKSDIDKYAMQQQKINATALDFEAKSAEANKKSDELFEKHHQFATSITLFQIAIALSALSALMKKKYLWLTSLAASAIGLYFFAIAIL